MEECLHNGGTRLEMRQAGYIQHVAKSQDNSIVTQLSIDEYQNG